MFNFLDYNDPIDSIPGTGIHIYSVLVAIGFMVAIIASWIKLYRRNIPTKTLEWGCLVISLAGIIGARAWFVLNNTEDMETIFDVVAVWRGGMAIEGGVTAAMIVGFFIFYRASKQLQISIWVFMDCIIPNVLLGQAIGRWGNFFNQEVLGANVGHPFSWLPMWMNNHLHYSGDYPDPVEFYRQPLFLYESLTSLFGWIFLTFFVPKAGQMFSKKPWKLYDDQFVSPLVTNAITKKDYFLPWKAIKKYLDYHQFKKQTWNAAYFDFNPNSNFAKNFVRKPWKGVNIKKEYKQNIKDKIKQKFTKFKYYMKPHAKPLNNVFNPNQYRITYTGVCGSLYFVFYGIIRMILEPLRDSRDIMMIGNVSTSMLLSAIWVIFGIILAICAQFFAPTRFRKGDWLYEKSY